MSSTAFSYVTREAKVFTSLANSSNVIWGVRIYLSSRRLLPCDVGSLWPKYLTTATFGYRTTSPVDNNHCSFSVMRTFCRASVADVATAEVWAPCKFALIRSGVRCSTRYCARKDAAPVCCYPSNKETALFGLDCRPKLRNRRRRHCAYRWHDVGHYRRYQWHKRRLSCDPLVCGCSWHLSKQNPEHYLI